MTSGSILLALALLIGVGFYIALPLLLPQTRRRQDVRSDERKELLSEKDHLMASLRALEFDWETGKIPDEVYQSQRARWTTRAAEILKQLEATSATAPRLQAVERDIEAAVAQLRRVPAGEIAPTAMVSTSNGAARRTAQFCPKCGQGVLVDDRFCAYCGHQLA